MKNILLVSSALILMLLCCIALLLSPKLSGGAAPDVRSAAFLPAHAGNAYKKGPPARFRFTREELAERLTDAVDAERIERVLRALTVNIGDRSLGSPGNKDAAAYLRKQLKDIGFSESRGTLIRQPFRSWGIDTENVIAVIPSNAPRPKILILSAHFDTVPRTGGAVDNGSGAALLLEMARILHDDGALYDFEIRICFFTGEENGYYGAIEYIEQTGAEELGRHMIFNIDMAGYNDNAFPKALVVSTRGMPSRNGPDPARANIVSDSIETAWAIRGDDTNTFLCPTNIGKHDIVPFFKHGVRGATLSWREIDPDRSEGAAYNIAWPLFMHTPDDSFDNINLDSLTETTKIALTAFAVFTERFEIQD